MRLLVLGSTGMLGRALIKEAKSRNIETFGMAEVGADFSFDIRDDIALEKLLIDLKPEIVINTVAIISHDLCEKDPGLAYQINSRPACILADICRKIGIYLVHISTDHYYSGHADRKHLEEESVCFLNEYARTKYIAETFALTYDQSLVVRTNIVGFKNFLEPFTFAEWVFDSLNNKKQLNLFSDFYTSSIDVKQFSYYFFNLIQREKPRGILNFASREVSSKKDFILDLAAAFGVSDISYKIGTIKSLKTIRAESLGLDVNKAEKLLGYQLPDKNMVIKSLISEYKELGDAI